MARHKILFFFAALFPLLVFSPACDLQKCSVNLPAASIFELSTCGTTPSNQFLDIYTASSSLSNYSFYTNFSATTMTAASLDYTVTGGEMEESSSAGTTVHSYGLVNTTQFSQALGDYTVEADFNLDHRTQNYGLFGLAFREQSNVTGYTFLWNGNVEHGPTPHWQVEKDTGTAGSSYTYIPPAGFGTGLAAPVYTPGNWVHMKVVTSGSLITCYVNLYDGNGEQLVYSVTDTTGAPVYTTGAVGFRLGYLVDPNMVHVRNYHAFTCP